MFTMYLLVLQYNTATFIVALIYVFFGKTCNLHVCNLTRTNTFVTLWRGGGEIRTNNNSMLSNAILNIRIFTIRSAGHKTIYYYYYYYNIVIVMDISYNWRYRQWVIFSKIAIIMLLLYYCLYWIPL